ncbi:hypothetical protein JYT44_01680 [Caldithrix abyssi]|nr:hypothetical protein [Caldithrix abyssi]
MIQLIKKNNFMILGVIVLVTLCIQVFPYIHFHHTHDDNNFNIIVGSHPINHEKSHHSEQHNGEHHHEGKEHFVGDWNFIRSISSSPLKISADLQLITNIIFDEKLEQVSIIQRESIHPPPNKISLFPDLSRGPPRYLS